MSSSFIRKALLQEAVNGKVRCLTCERRCLLAEGQVGWCRTRQNWGGTLYTLTYGLVSSLSCNPIEKKPLYHFHPGSLALTAGSLSCNFACPWCQNWHISKQTPPIIESASQQSMSDCDHLACPWCQNWHISKSHPSGGEFISPEDFVRRAQRLGSHGTSISFNEPTLSLEWSLDVFRLARAQGLYNTYVTNGYMTPEALRLLVEAGLDAMNVDVKGDPAAVRRYCGVDVERVWRNCLAASAALAQQAGVWLEITTLVIPGVNDEDGVLRAIAERIVTDLGSHVPWHVSRYHPAYRFDAPSTPVSTLEGAREVGLEAGLRYVYLGNVPGHPSENTFCPECGRILVMRDALQLSRRSLGPDGVCPRCGEEIAGVAWHRDDDA